ncbi:MULTISPECIES: hypothetical protein [unclassified Endozoicomonas]|uniref:hypothetical protein n=3 Tax=Endozoicomonas TaxID=305899 RepID=UPI002148AFE3|nr:MULTISPECIES: hypothetical protein [unclassified Endozoicomonas]
MDRIIRHSFLTALLFLVLLLSVACQAEPLAERFIATFEHNAAFPNHSFSIKHGLSTLFGNPSDITDTKDYTRLDLTPDDRRHRFNSYRVKTTLIESISWQWIYATHLLVGYELIQTTNSLLSSHPYSCLPVEVFVVIVGWLLKSSLNPDSTSFNPIEQQEVTAMRTREDHPFATITMMFGSGQNQQPQQLAESLGQQAPGANSHLIDSFISFLFSGSGGGNGGSQQLLHTFGLNCFVFPCFGVCMFRPLSDEPTQWPLNCEANSTGNPSQLITTEGACSTAPAGSLSDDVTMHGNLPVTDNDSMTVARLISLGNHSRPEENGPSFTPTLSTGPMGTSPSCRLSSGGATHCHQTLSGQKERGHIEPQACDMIMVGRDGQPQPCKTVSKNAKALSVHKSNYHTGQKTCSFTVVGRDGQPRPCGTVCKNAQALLYHKKKHNTEQKTCDVIVVGEDGQLRPCRKVCKNTITLWNHKNRQHTGQQTCEVTVIGKDGQPRPCEVVCKNAGSLRSHRSSVHSKQKTCEMTVVGEDGQPRPCGKVCKNNQNLFYHKRRDHSGQQTCNLTLVGKDGKPRPCGMICKNAQFMSTHRRSVHSGKKTCETPVVGKDGLQRQCGKVCKNAKALSDHKRTHHSGQKTCDATIVGDDGQPQPCGALCRNSQALSSHRSKAHRRRKTCEVKVVSEDARPQLCETACRSAQALSGHKTRHQKWKPDNRDQGPCSKKCKLHE